MAAPTPTRVLRYAVLAASLWYLGAYLAIAGLRVQYPFDLEWMEGGSVDHVARVLRLEPLYIPPQVAFIPFEYPPLYFYVSAVVAKVIGLGYLPLRLVSLVSSLVCFVCIYAAVKGATRRAFPAIVAVGAFAATFRIGGAWLDLARVDTLFLALFLGAILVLRQSTSWPQHALAGVVLALSYLTKQTALAMAVPVVLWALFADLRRGLALAGGLAAVAGTATLLLHVSTHGWFTFYVWLYPFKHGFAQPVWWTFWTRDLLAPLPIALTVTMLLIAWQCARRRRDDLFWPAVCAGMIAGAYRSRLQTGGYDNVLLPAFAIIAIMLGLAVGLILGALEQRQGRRVLAAEAAVHATCLVQMALLWYDPRVQVPRPGDWAAGEHLLSVLASVPGDVLLAHHGYLPTRVGKPTHAHLMQVFDILKVGDEQSARLAAQFRSAIRQKSFAAIVLDDTSSYFFMQDINAAYALQSRVFAQPDVFYPVTGGVIIRPEYVYVPKPTDPAAAGTSAQQRVDEAFQRLRHGPPRLQPAIE
ncbi:MAG TPA: glycosyltransferase family 39 protein [Vicinamibacterales bacterium]|nr:glycosyltransferase family 39 protein [Vicinamibacterales bacterium]